MRDRRTEGAFARRALTVHMDPLVITRAVGELRNARLIERDPGGDAHLLTDVLAQLAQRHCLRHSSPRLLPGIGFNLCGRDAPRAPVARILPSVLSRAVEE